MTFWFAEYFGSDHISQRAEIERLARLGGRRRDAVLKARALEMLVIEPSGKPKRGEPARIAKELKNCKVTSVQGWIEEFQRKVDYLVKHRCVMTRVQAWGCIKKLHPDAVIERGIQRSMLGRKAGKGPRRRSGW